MNPMVSGSDVVKAVFSGTLWTLHCMPRSERVADFDLQTDEPVIVAE